VRTRILQEYRFLRPNRFTIGSSVFAQNIVCRAVATRSGTRRQLPPRYVTGENGIGVMMHELTFNELVVESRYLLKLQSDKITKIL